MMDEEFFRLLHKVKSNVRENDRDKNGVLL